MRDYFDIPRDTAARDLREVDRSVSRWVLAHGGSSALAGIAARASYADGQADAAIILSDEEVATLANQRLVGEGRALTPFVIDANSYFYLWRNYAAEQECASQLLARRAASVPLTPGQMQMAEQFIAQELGPGIAVAQQAQADALRMVGGQKLFVLTGGPGTGKTTTIRRMLQLFGTLHSDKDLKIQVAATTGKAAQRLVESLGDAFALEPLTVHRLLNTSVETVDVLVIDEASMLDLAMLQAVLKRLRPDAALILVGDANQLNSVGTGSVFADLVAAFNANPQNDLATLTHNFRGVPQIDALNRAALSEDSATLQTVLQDVSTPAQLKAHLEEWARWILQDGTVRPAHEEITDAQALAALTVSRQRALLCALREGPFGSLEINKSLAKIFRRELHLPDDARFSGQLLMVTRNDYRLELFNGDIGIVLRRDGQWQVAFPKGDELRWFPVDALDATESAFAITIHKSQGSEYDEVALLLPPVGGDAILARELIYTGISRARQRVQIWGSPSVLAKVLAKRSARIGGLRASLQPWSANTL